MTVRVLGFSGVEGLGFRVSSLGVCKRYISIIPL